MALKKIFKKKVLKSIKFTGQLKDSQKLNNTNLDDNIYWLLHKGKKELISTQNVESRVDSLDQLFNEIILAQFKRYVIEFDEIGF